MIRRESKSGKTRITFVLPKEEPAGKVSVVGDFNGWTPGTHTLVRRSNGTRSVGVSLTPGASYRFRYLGEDGHWFDDPEVDRCASGNGVVLA